jgi:hypothetical protein
MNMIEKFVTMVKGAHEQWYNSMMEKLAEEPDEESVTEIIAAKVEDKYP